MRFLPIVITLCCLLATRDTICQDLRRCALEESRISAEFEARIHNAVPVTPRTVVTIPVVFHVVYRRPEANISAIQIQNQIDILNRDFANMSDHILSVPEEFSGLTGDTGFRFCLAATDPEGNPTSGITRTFTTLEDIGTVRQADGRSNVCYEELRGVDAWDQSRYVNIWVADMVGLLGSSSIPGTMSFPEEDGIIIDPDFVGSVGLAADSEPFHLGHTLTHEMGHYFGLYHIWGPGNGGCEFDDFIEDTPAQDRPYIGCPFYPQYSCGSSDMFMNFMDFTSDDCLAMFTQGQIVRMQTVLQEFRSALAQSAATLCEPPMPGSDPDHADVFYAPGTNQIIIALASEPVERHTVVLYAIDGRYILTDSWQIGSTFVISCSGIPAGIYLVRLMAGGVTSTRKVFVSG